MRLHSSSMSRLTSSSFFIIAGVPLVQGDLFGGVAAGLAYAAHKRFG